jgi:hypothetical protein
MIYQDFEKAISNTFPVSWTSRSYGASTEQSASFPSPQGSNKNIISQNTKEIETDFNSNSSWHWSESDNNENENDNEDDLD